MSKMVREMINLDPLAGERMDNSGAVHRYNFGWVKTHRLVGLDMESQDGVKVEDTITSVSGYSVALDEQVWQDILPPSLELPEVEASTGMSDGYELATYTRIGEKTRVYTKVKPFGGSEIVEMGKIPFSVVENKEYADAIKGDGNPLDVSPEVAAADSGTTIVIADGVKTETKVRG